MSLSKDDEGGKVAGGHLNLTLSTIASLFIVVGMWFMWFKDFIKALTSKNNFI